MARTPASTPPSAAAAAGSPAVLGAVLAVVPPSPGSLQARLLLAAASGIVLALVLVGALLVTLFQQQVQAELAQRVQGQLEGLIGALGTVPAALPAASSVAGPGPTPGEGQADAAAPAGLRLLREPIDPAFRQPFSGQYWWVAGPDGSLLRSRSWWDHPLQPPALAEVASHDAGPLPFTGPRGQALLVWARTVDLPGLDTPVQVAVAASRSGLDAATTRFTGTLAVSLGALALALVAAAALQVRLGLAPLVRLRTALAQWRAGRAPRLQGRYPAEVQPLVDDLNSLLADNTALVETARQQTGNLAHALKTPLAVLGNAAQGLPAADAALWREQLAQMQRQVELHLVRARASAVQHAAARRQGTGTAVQPVVAELLHTLGRLYTERALQLSADPPSPGAPLLVATGRDELQEMLGNLLDNACKWAQGQVRVRVWARVQAGRWAEAPDALPGPGADRAVPPVCICIDDDGPGIAPADRARVLQRGQRLDETRPGSGLGLAIVDDLARLHGGQLRLHTAPAGGLRAELLLPGA